MSIFKRIFSKKKRYSDSEKELIAMHICPDCWNWSEYNDVFYEENINLNSEKLDEKAFIEKFVETNIIGVRLKPEGKDLKCPKCKQNYKIE